MYTEKLSYQEGFLKVLVVLSHEYSIEVNEDSRGVLQVNWNGNSITQRFKDIGFIVRPDVPRFNFIHMVIMTKYCELRSGLSSFAIILPVHISSWRNISFTY